MSVVGCLFECACKGMTEQHFEKTVFFSFKDRRVGRHKTTSAMLNRKKVEIRFLAKLLENQDFE